MKKIFTLFAGLALTGSLSANAEKVTLYPEIYDFEKEEYQMVADPQETEISKDEEGNFIISNFLYSGNSLSFKFDIPAVDNYSDITFTGYLDRSSTYPYILNADGYYPSCYLYNYENIEGPSEIYYPYVCEEGYSWVYRYDMSAPENEGYKEFEGCINISGFTATDDYYPWMYIYFYFDMPEVSAVESIDASAADARVEYFNLAGQRVENPSNGVFIRLQGGKASKVVK